MSADNYYILKNHPKGGFALVMGFASADEEPEAREDSEQFPDVMTALKAYSEGQEWKDDGYYPKYYNEYGLEIDPEIFETGVLTETGLDRLIDDINKGDTNAES